MTAEEGLSRREFIPGALGAAAGLGVGGLIGYELHPETEPAAPSKPEPAPTASAGPREFQSFFTEPGLKPPVVRVTNLDPASATSSPRFILFAPRVIASAGDAQEGVMIIDRKGRLVWFQPITTGSDFDFDAQSYNGRPVLTWWQGRLESAHGYGTGEIADDAYRTINTIKAGNGLQADLHELFLTSAGTALITAYETTTADLSAQGGSRNGKLVIGHAQEIDLKTGKLLFDWDSSKFVPISESYELASRKGTYDYFHINSVAETDDGNLLISGRNTWALYKVDRSTGKILWRLNGKRSDFTLDPAARFYWQHHARALGSNTITLFDNAVRKERQSRGLVLSLNTAKKHVSLEHAYVHPAGLDSTALGSVELQPDGRVFVGWGDQPYFSEFAPDGTLLLDGQLPIGIGSYRAFVRDWVGHPTGQPKILARANPAGGFVVYASWNGATEIDQWTILAGTNRTSLAPVGSQEWTGLETAIVVNSTGPYFAAVALDKNGNELGRSAIA
jgi:outer membrane protein assembly factor BamB